LSLFTATALHVYGKWTEKPDSLILEAFKMKNILLLIFMCYLAPNAFAQMQAPAKEVTCRACHGPMGGSPVAPNYPKLNNQNKVYLVSSLKAYRAGERKGGLSMIMYSQAAQLSDADIEALASYYSMQK
jgi:cytochrome c